MEANLAASISSLDIKNAGEKIAEAQKGLDDAVELYEAGAGTAANIEKLKTALENAKANMISFWRKEMLQQPRQISS